MPNMVAMINVDLIDINAKLAVCCLAKLSYYNSVICSNMIYIALKLCIYIIEVRQVVHYITNSLLYWSQFYRQCSS